VIRSTLRERRLVMTHSCSIPSTELPGCPMVVGPVTTLVRRWGSDFSTVLDRCTNGE
jgi:hypothetical protein